MYALIFKMGFGVGGLGFGVWGLAPTPNPQSPIPNPQSPIPIIYYKMHNIYLVTLFQKEN